MLTTVESIALDVKCLGRYRMEGMWQECRQTSCTGSRLLTDIFNIFNREHVVVNHLQWVGTSCMPSDSSPSCDGLNRDYLAVVFFRSRPAVGATGQLSIINGAGKRPAWNGTSPLLMFKRQPLHLHWRKRSAMCMSQCCMSVLYSMGSDTDLTSLPFRLRVCASAVV